MVFLMEGRIGETSWIDGDELTDLKLLFDTLGWEMFVLEDVGSALVDRFAVGMGI